MHAARLANILSLPLERSLQGPSSLGVDHPLSGPSAACGVRRAGRWKAMPQCMGAGEYRKRHEPDAASIRKDQLLWGTAPRMPYAPPKQPAFNYACGYSGPYSGPYSPDCPGAQQP